MWRHWRQLNAGPQQGVEPGDRFPGEGNSTFGDEHADLPGGDRRHGDREPRRLRLGYRAAGCFADRAIGQPEGRTGVEQNGAKHQASASQTSPGGSVRLAPGATWTVPESAARTLESTLTAGAGAGSPPELPPPSGRVGRALRRNTSFRALMFTRSVRKPASSQTRVMVLLDGLLLHHAGWLTALGVSGAPVTFSMSAKDMGISLVGRALR